MSEIAVHLTISRDVPIERRDALLAVASHCTVHNSLTQPPLVRITAEAPAASSAIR